MAKLFKKDIKLKLIANIPRFYAKGKYIYLGVEIKGKYEGWAGPIKKCYVRAETWSGWKWVYLYYGTHYRYLKDLKSRIRDDIFKGEFFCGGSNPFI